MDYCIAIGCALFFAILSTIVLRSVAEYGVVSNQVSDETSELKEGGDGLAGDNRIHDQILPMEYGKYFACVCITVLSTRSSLCGTDRSDYIYIVGLQLV